MIDHAYSFELSVAGKVMTEPFVLDVLKDTIGGLGGAVEAAERGEAVCPRLDFSAWATDETKNFVAAVKDPKTINVSVYEYDAQFPTKRYRRFAGKLVELPRRGKTAYEDVYLFSAVGFLSTYGEVDVIDPASGGAYRDVYYTDLAEELLKDADHPAGHSFRHKAITSFTPFTSRLFYPGRHRFRGAYNTTDKITAICNDGANIYLGVGPYLCRYNPNTREAVTLAHLNYIGTKLDLYFEQWRIASLAYSGGTVYGWAESKFDDIRYSVAHVKVRFTWAAGNVINLTDANVTYCYDRGYWVKSQGTAAINRGGPSGNDFALWYYKRIGDPMPVTDKTLGKTYLDGARFKEGVTVVVQYRGVNWVEGISGIDVIKIGDKLALQWGVIYQFMGKVLEAKKVGNYWKAKVQERTNYEYPLGTEVHIFVKIAEEKEQNLMLPGSRKIKVHYEQVDIGSPTPVHVRVERRRTDENRSNFFWPEILGNVSEDETLFASNPYLALGEGNLPEQYKVVGADRYYVSEDVPQFYLEMEDAANFANLPADGYWVKTDPQKDITCQPGESVLMFNGNAVTITNESNDVLSTRGKIWLAKENGTCYVAWNRWRWAPGNNHYFQTVWANLNGAKAFIIGRDRKWENYQGRPSREITGFAVHNGRFWFGVKRVAPNWRNTDMQIIWAAPPQGPDKPTDYDGGMVAVCMVTYDKTEYLKQGGLIRVGGLGKPGDKEYLISEVEAIAPREITNTDHSYRTYYAEGRTYFVLFELDGFPRGGDNYRRQAKAELADKYITIMSGWDIKGEICYADGDELKAGRTATAEYGEAFEGDLYDYNEEEWHGENVMAEYDEGPFAVAVLTERRVIPGSITVTLKDGKKIFKVTDKTNMLRGEIPIPPLNEVYVKLKEGEEYDEAHLYFNPAYALGRLKIPVSGVVFTLPGMAFDVRYSYYVERFYVAPFIYRNDLYFNETETGAVYRRMTDYNWLRVTAWPAPVAAVDVLGNDVYALAEVDGGLMRYGKIWPGYINAEVGGADAIDIFTALAKIAQAADCFLGEDVGKVLFRPRELPESITQGTAYEGFESAQHLEQKQYRGALITYANGKAYYGLPDAPDDLIFKRDMPYVSDYGHGRELAKRYFEYFDSGAVLYDLETAREDLAVPALAEMVAVGDIDGRLIAYEIRGPKISMAIEKTVGGRTGMERT